MAKEIVYGVFGTGKAIASDDGSIEMFAIIQESGLFCGAPPAEYRIRELVPADEEEFAKQYCALLNRKTDLPFYLSKVTVKVLPGLSLTVTDEMLTKEGIKTLP